TQLGTLTPGAENGLGSITLSGIIADRTYQLLISALEQNDSTKTLSAPRITVLNNQTARIRKGDVLPYPTSYSTETYEITNPGGTPVTGTALVPEDFEDLELGVTLDVKVNVGNDGRTIVMALKPVISDLVRWDEYTTTGGEGDNDNDRKQEAGDTGAGLATVRQPVTNENFVSTTVAVNSGETVVLGGMIETMQSQTVKKVPLLGDIPWIGYLFRHTVDRDEPQHLIIFVTATVIDESGQFIRMVESGD
ncbi:MAG: type II and III secretion system protein, partial [Lentisphaeria bacterium]|nr:type II and III secretion system protein [Lentisphaeria bacterium]